MADAADRAEKARARTADRMRAAADRAKKARSRAAELVAVRDELVRDAARSGWMSKDIAEATGLTLPLIKKLTRGVR